jgi:hypothetical protein
MCPECWFPWATEITVTSSLGPVKTLSCEQCEKYEIIEKMEIPIFKKRKTMNIIEAKSTGKKMRPVNFPYFHSWDEWKESVIKNYLTDEWEVEEDEKIPLTWSQIKESILARAGHKILHIDAIKSDLGFK